MDEIKEMLTLIPQSFVEKLCALQKLDIEAKDLMTEADRRAEDIYKALPKKRPSDAEAAEVTGMYNRALELTEVKTKLANEMEAIVKNEIADLADEHKHYCHMIIKDVSQYREVLEHHRKREQKREAQRAAQFGPSKFCNCSFFHTRVNAAESCKIKWIQSHKEDLPKIGEVVEQLGVDTHESKFCSCRKIAYGKMIQCEGAECPYDWFHLHCVGLAKKPTGKWVCETCMKRKDVKTEPSEDMKTEPSEDMKTEPSEDMKTEPSEDMKTEPSEDMKTG
ncbi:hypothetical protein L596_000710 [Steinernema carpocapsae]|uniref:Inhibitor of growth protein n=1 Tax=Steinernema carpocapsae TaxID=34508 RepID=A0A4U8ULC4_STECR|nr:hypothetical protein L596_000710 [Steinernema carpocapsae]